MRDTVKHLASDLSSRYSTLLADLVLALNRKRGRPPASSVSPTTDHTRLLLEEAFSFCISLKARLSARGTSFEIFMPAFGEIFDSGFMQISSTDDEEPRASQRQVLVSTRPAFFSYSEPSEVRYPPSEASSLVRLNDCFVQRRQISVVTTKPIAKATVVLCDE